MSQIKIIFLGDIVGKIGREAVKEVLPQLRQKYTPDLIIANAENLAHGKGVTIKTIQEMLDCGIDCFTSGNHIWSNPEIFEIFSNKKIPLIRPANYPEENPGTGAIVITVGPYQILLVNLMGQAFFSENFSSPIKKLNEILAENSLSKPSAIIVDIHAEATSEKQVLAHYFDGKVSAIVGTHTHVQTADERILQNGTAFITDVGMCGFSDGSLGVELSAPTQKMLTQIPTSFNIPEQGSCQVNGVFVIIKPENGKATKIERIQEFITI